MRIAVTGPQNTGKTTFLADFISAFPEYTTPSETYRDIATTQLLPINQVSTTESQRVIRDFLFAQTKAHPEANVIFDRCIIDNYVYTSVQHERGRIPKTFLDETDAMMQEVLHDVDTYFFIPTALGVTLHHDHLRDIDPDYIDVVNRHFLETLFRLVRDHHINVEVIAGSRDTRIALARGVLENA